MQGLVYAFIALAALGVAAAAYFGLTFSPIESLVTGVAFACLAMVLLERRLRQRAEARLEKGVEDLSRLLAADAQAGAALAQRFNDLVDVEAAPRLDSLEADLSVLGTVVRQLAESLAELEEQRRATSPVEIAPVEPDPDKMSETIIPLEMLKQAIADGRLVFHIEPIVTLPQRKGHGYDLVPRLQLEEEGDFADRPDFMPRHGGEDTIALIESLALEEAVVIARRSRTAGTPITLYVPLSRALLGQAKSVEMILTALDANRAIASALLFAVPQADFRAFSAKERASIAAIGKMGVGLSLANASSLRFDYAELQGMGFRTVRIDATRFLRQPEGFTDFHSADIAAYGRRFGIELIATGIIDEQQLLALFENGISLAQGPHIAAPGPVRPDLLVERVPKMSILRAEG